jgi:hypothetical protein
MKFIKVTLNLKFFKLMPLLSKTKIVFGQNRCDGTYGTRYL